MLRIARIEDSLRREIVMRKTTITVAVVTVIGLLGAVLLAPTALWGQEEEEEAQVFIYVTYSVCSLADQWRADEIVTNHRTAIMDAALEEGVIQGWGWLAHHTGGQWRRASYYAAGSIEALLDAAEVVNGNFGEQSPRAANEFSRICPTHDDYIWRRVAGSSKGLTGLEGRAGAGFSVYDNCDMANESRADEIVKEVMAPIYDRLVAEGALASWGWWEHIVGGEWRRLATMTAADDKSLMKARSAIIQELIDDHGDALEEYSSICGSHQDYIWDIQISKP